MLQRPHQPDRDRCPGRIGDDALAAAGAGREQVQLAILSPDQAAEQEAAGGAWDKDVTVERMGVVLGLKPLQPDLVAGAIVADAREPRRRGRRASTG